MSFNRCDEMWGFPKWSYVPYVTLWQVDYKGTYFPLNYQVVNYQYNNLQAYTSNSGCDAEEQQITRNTMNAISKVGPKMNMKEGQVHSEIRSPKQTQLKGGEQCHNSNIGVLKNKSKSCSNRKVIPQLPVGGIRKKVFTPAQGKLKNRNEQSESNYYSRKGARTSIGKDCTSQTKCKTDSFQEDVQRNKRRVPVCRHFVRGFCERGDSCCFHHIESGTVHQSPKVFICGLPPNTTEVALRRKLSTLGISVINKSVSIHQSWPCVELASPREAQKLIKMGNIVINGSFVEVRSWKSVAERQRARIADISRRSIFLGGLTKSTTCDIVRLTLEKIGAKVVNLMKIKRGFCPKVTLSSVQQKEMLVLERKIKINGSMVDVRPYLPQRLG